MTLHFRLICCAVLLFVVSATPAANVVPGLDVVVRKGSSSVFRGVTDGRGRFETGPLNPGVYTIEVRTVPNAPPSSARFFLAMAGAKPVGDAMIRPGVALAMDAMVRSQTGIRGQVSARGGIVYLPRVPSGDRNPSNAATPVPAVNAPPRQSPAPLSNSGQIAKPLTPNRPVTTNPPVAFARTQAVARTIPTPAPTAMATVTSPESVLVRRPAGYQPRIINGRRHFWVPSAPGSNLGRWTPESVSRPAVNAPPSNNAPVTQPSPRPSPTPHR